MTKHVSNFYNGKPEKEWNRLEHPYTAFEFATTIDLIDKHFPKEGKVCDIGCGPGRYSIELLRRGYDVSLVDLSEELLEIAKAKMAELQTPKASRVVCANACDLSMFPDEEFDAILHLGPMYHLINRESRQAALTELARILKPGATAIVSYLNSWGVLRYGLSRFPERYADLGFLRGMIDDVAIPESFENFTECFWSTPPNAALEIEQAGFEVQTYIGCESFAAGQKAAIQKVAEENPSAYENILQFVRETCELEQFRSTGEHIHFVVQRQKSDAQKMRREH